MRRGIDEGDAAEGLAPPGARGARERVGQHPPAVLERRVDTVEGEGPDVVGRVIKGGNQRADDKRLWQVHRASHLDDGEVSEPLIHIGPDQVEVRAA